MVNTTEVCLRVSRYDVLRWEGAVETSGKMGIPQPGVRGGGGVKRVQRPTGVQATWRVIIPFRKVSNSPTQVSLRLQRPRLLLLASQVTTIKTFFPSFGNVRSAKPRPKLTEATPHGDPPFQVSSGPLSAPVPVSPQQPNTHLRPRGTSVGSPLRVLKRRCFMESPPPNFCLLRLAEMAAAHGLQLIHLSRGDCHSA